jgi:RNA recognition motif. (a.k.a. RRM, RBD, or RNP domain)
MPSFPVLPPDQQQQSTALASSISNAPTQSVSGPLASHPAGSNASLNTASGSASSIPSLSSGQSSSSTLASVSEDPLKSQSGQGETNNSGGGKSDATFVNSITSSFVGQQVQDPLSSERYIISEESWKHHAQARAILSNLIGPNGEQLSSSDPYNTTVFVGGLSPLISEDTLRTFFEPFGDIHYVRSFLFR